MTNTVLETGKSSIQPAGDLLPSTSGIVLHSPVLYDFTVWLAFLGKENRFREKVLNLGRVATGESVLDVGCGTGTLAIAAKKRVGTAGIVHGVDASVEMLATAKKKATKAGVEVFFKSDVAEALPFPDAQFNVVLSTVMLHHLPQLGRLLVSSGNQPVNPRSPRSRLSRTGQAKGDRARGSTMRMILSLRSFLLALVVLATSTASFAQVGISVSFGPPALPVYEQPVCPGDGYLWTPGYWAYDDDGYYWVPGTWVEAPQVGFLWTPGYWGWGGNAFIFHEGYWGPQVGFYGGINYGFGYGGVGYEGGRWEGSRFSYNTYVTHVNTTIIHNTYNTTVTNVTETHVSYNGGTGGVEVRPTSQQESYANQHHVGPVASQAQHVQEARKNPPLRAAANQGKPPIAATVKPADFKTGAVSSKQAGGAYKPPPSNAARGKQLVHSSIWPPRAAVRQRAMASRILR